MGLNRSKKNERKQCVSVRINTAYTNRQLPNGKCSVSIISCTALSFKALLENNNERIYYMESILRSLCNSKIIPWERREPRNKKLLEVVRRQSSFVAVRCMLSLRRRSNLGGVNYTQ